MHNILEWHWIISDSCHPFVFFSFDDELDSLYDSSQLELEEEVIVNVSATDAVPNTVTYTYTETGNQKNIKFNFSLSHNFWLVCMKNKSFIQVSTESYS